MKTPSKCVIEWCYDPAKARRLCNKHYTRWKRSGISYEEFIFHNGVYLPYYTKEIVDSYNKGVTIEYLSIWYNKSPLVIEKFLKDYYGANNKEREEEEQ